MADNLLTGDQETGNLTDGADVQEQGIKGDSLTGQDDASPEGKQASPEPRTERPAWMGQLPKELQVDDALTKFPTIGELGKAYRELEGKFGKAIIVPDEKASPEEREAYYKKIGRPETPDGYEIKPPKMPKGLEMSEETLKECKAIAHKAGMTTAQTQTWIDDMGEITKKSAEAAQKRAEAQAIQVKEVLAKEWGDGYNQQVSYMKKAFKTFGNPAIGKMFDSTGLTNSPDICKMFAAIGKTISEDKFVDGQKGPQSLNPADILYPKK